MEETMRRFTKNGLLFLSILLPSGCFPGIRNAVPEPIRMSGLTMGTSYSVVYFDPSHRDLKPAIDSILELVNGAISNFDPLSTVSRFNQSNKGVDLSDLFFHTSLRKALEVAASSNGAFDPTVMPLVNAWGSGSKLARLPDADEIDSIREFVGYRKVTMTADSVIKSDPRVELDFGGIGQGYGADVLSNFLLAKGVSNFVIEIGGEGFVSGKNLLKNSEWVVGILDPESTRDHQFFRAYARLENRAFTTSGNYFNYREIDGVKYGHTIDPITGCPVHDRLRSVSVFARDCATADAWATALMVVGLEKAIAMLNEHRELDALLMYSLPDGAIATYTTPAIKEFISLEQ